MKASQKQSRSPNVSDYKTWWNVKLRLLDRGRNTAPKFGDAQAQRAGRSRAHFSRGVRLRLRTESPPSRKRWVEFAPRLSWRPLPGLRSPCVPAAAPRTRSRASWAARPLALHPSRSCYCCCCSCSGPSDCGAPSSPSSCRTTPSSVSTKRWSRA